jgi:hypothetical protein
MTPDPATSNIILRAEYEARQASIDARVTKIESELAALRHDVNEKLDKVVSKIDDLRDDVYRYRDTALKTAVGWMISFIIGSGGMVALLQVVHVIR